MKAWFGVLGRSILEFMILLAAAALVVGASQSLAAQSPRIQVLLSFARSSLPALFPALMAAALFLSLFSFEYRVKSRAAGWLGLVLLGLFLSGVGLALARVPFLAHLVSPSSSPSSSVEPVLQEAGQGIEVEGRLVWFRAAEGRRVQDLVVVPFPSPYPRVRYAASAEVDESGSIELDGSRYTAVRPPYAALPLAPELSYFEGSWVWQRRANERPLLEALAAALGFVLLASGFRFTARLTRWPLANLLFGIAAFPAFLLLDASLWSPAVTGVMAGLAPGAGLAGMPSTFIPAAAEALLGLVLGGIDLIWVPRDRRERG